MKFWFVFSLLFIGCSAEVADVNAPTSPQETRDYSYASDTNGPSDCPPPVVYTTIENGQEVTRIFYPNCAGAQTNKSKASDPPGWGSDGTENGTDQYPTGPAPTVNRPQPGDPVPRLMK